MKPLAVDGKRAGPMPRPSPLGRPSGLLSGLSATSGTAGGLPKPSSSADLRALDFKPTAERMDRNRSAMVWCFCNSLQSCVRHSGCRQRGVHCKAAGLAGFGSTVPSFIACDGHRGVRTVQLQRCCAHVWRYFRP